MEKVNLIVNVDSIGIRYEYGAGFGRYAYAGPSPSATAGEVVGQTVAAAMNNICCGVWGLTRFERKSL